MKKVRWILGAALGLSLVAGCSFSVNPRDGATTGVGENSSFTRAGAEHIVDEGRARIDLREPPLLSTDLGADAEHRLRGFDERSEDPIEVTLIGTEGELVVHAEVATFLVQQGGDRVLTFSLFEGQQDANDLDLRLREVGATVGASETDIESYLSSVPFDPERKNDIWLNDNNALGFRIGLHPVKQPDGVAIIEYLVTFDSPSS